MSKNKISGKVLAIQIGSKEMQILLMGSNAEILHSTAVPVPSGAVEDGMIWNEEAVRDLLKETLKAPEFKHVRQTVFTLCTSQVISETITTPDLPKAKLEKLIEANADMYFPVDTHDYKMVWEIVGPNAGGVKELSVQLWAIPMNMIARYYRVANDCGLSVQAIDYCGHSVATAIGATFSKPGKAGASRKKLNLNMELSFGKKKAAEPEVEEAEEEEEIRQSVDTDLHLLLERDLLGMTFVQAGQVVFQRFIRCGNDPTYQFSEIAMMVEYFRTMEIGRGSAINGIVAGYFADDTRMVDELCDVLGIPLLKLETAYASRWLLCAGAVHTELDFGDASLNKVKTASTQMRSHLWQYGLILAGALAVFAAVMLLLTSRLTWDTEIKGLESQQQLLQIQAQKTAGFADNYYEYENLYNAYDQDWNNVFASLYAYNDNLAQVMEELENILPETASVTNMQISAQGLNVEFACETKEDAAYLIMALREMKYIDRENLVVSDLTGGGSGPATSYGTGESAPTKGSGTVDLSDLKDAIVADLSDPYEVGYWLGLGKEARVDLLDDLMAAYGVTPSSEYSSLEDVDADFDTRAAAFREMCTTNPYAMYMARQLIIENQESELGLLLQEEDIFWDNAIDWKNYNSVDDLEEDLEGLLDLLLTDEMVTAEAKFGATEALIAKEPDALLWYLYYLEAGGSAPYMDMDAAAAGLVNDRNDDGILNALNAQIYSKVLSESTKKALKPEDYVAAALKNYLTSGPAEDGMDSYIEGYLAIRSSGDPYVDTAIVTAFDNGSVDAEIAALVEESYGEEGATGIAVVDALFTKAKSENNVTGIDAFDTAIAAYLNNQSGGEGGGNEGGEGGGNEDVNPDDNTGAGEGGGNEGGGDIGGGEEGVTYKDKVAAYITTGESGDDNLNVQLYSTLNNTSENVELDNCLKSFVEDYHVTGTSGDTALDDMIKAYEENETSTGFVRFDAIIDAYNSTGDDNEGGDGNEGIGDGNENDGENEFGQYLEQVPTAFKLYLRTGSTSNVVGAEPGSKVDAAFGTYILTGDSGFPEVNNVLDSEMNKGTFDTELKRLVEQYDTEGKTKVAAIDTILAPVMADPSNGGTGIERLDIILKDYFKEDDEGGGNTGEGGSDDDGSENMDYEELLEKYLTTGTTGDNDLDNQIKFALASGMAEPYLKSFVEKYYNDGSTGNKALDDKIKAYKEKGTSTGIAELDKAIDDYDPNLDWVNKVGLYLADYLDDGVTSPKLAGYYLDEFFMNRGNGPDEDNSTDTIILNYLATKKADQTLWEVFDKYYEKNGKTNIKGIDYILSYEENHRINSGIMYLDNLFFAYQIQKLEKTENRVEELEKKLEEANKKAKEQQKNSGSGKKEVEDDRYRFSAVLGYTDELREAELKRKGISKDDKIAPLEVEE